MIAGDQRRQADGPAWLYQLADGAQAVQMRLPCFEVASVVGHHIHNGFPFALPALH